MSGITVLIETDKQLVSKYFSRDVPWNVSTSLVLL